jgi:prepilin-type N-terminal cleavage/methylation domain-containing protein
MTPLFLSSCMKKSFNHKPVSFMPTTFTLKSGFSLIELLVAIAILSLVMLTGFKAIAMLENRSGEAQKRVVWHEKAFVAVKFRRACQAFLLRWRNRGLSRAFTTWRLLFSREKHYAAICGASLYLYVLSRRETGGKQGILLTILVE